MSEARTQVGIVGAGPAGLLLGRLLGLAGLDCVIVERQTQAHVAARVRAGVLESSTVDLLDQAEVGARMRREGLVHDGIEVAFDGERQRIDFRALTGQGVVIYGQTELTRDLQQAHERAGTRIYYACSDVSLHELCAAQPRLHFTCGGRTHRIECDFIAGCDGFHGVARASIPAAARQEYERVYPFGWLGVLSDTPPVAPELVYASHARGFALCSMRTPTRSRYYVQVDADADLAVWPDTRFWDELAARLPAAVAANLFTGPAIEKNIAPLRSFVTEPMRYGNLFLAGDAAHIVPPTGAKGLNLAVGDVRELATALRAWYAGGEHTLLDAYSATRLARVWQAERFSWWFTALTHRLSDDPFARRLQQAEFAQLAHSPAARTALAENYVGLSHPGSGRGDLRRSA